MPPESLTLGGGRLAALGWGRAGAPVWLALHGWLDNAASFCRLAPIVSRALDIRLVALDMAGHGHSAHRGEGADYPLWGYLTDVVEALDSLETGPVTLLGHSLGASVATLFAAVQPERVERLVLLDGLIGTTVEATDTADQLRLALTARRRPPRQTSSFESIEAAVDARVRGGVTRLDADTARPVVERNLVLDDGGRYHWRTDRRLTWPSSVRFTPAQMGETVARVTAPALLIQATGGVLAGNPQAALARERMPTLARRVLPGGHHLHLERLCVDAVASEILDWVARARIAER